MLPGKELLYPFHLTKKLADACDRPGWKELVERVKDLDETSPEALAFSLMMIRFNNCLDCKTDSEASIEGCEWCCRRFFRRFLRTRDPITEYEGALLDVQAYIFERLSNAETD